jgi:hypothetical protein
VADEAIKHSVPYRLNTEVRRRWPQVASLDVRYRGQFGYVEAQLADGTVRSPSGCATRGPVGGHLRDFA